MRGCRKQPLWPAAVSIVVATVMLGASPVYAQGPCARLIVDATDLYRAGDFDSAIERAQECPDRGSSFEERESKYALLTNVYLALDRVPDAERSATELLRANPEFAPAVDASERFRQLIVRIRRELARDGVSSVSKMNETLLEAPATVVVVTADQIRRRGYQDLEAVLHDLPGFDISRTSGQSYSNIYQRGYRSDGTNRTLFLVDGVEQNDLFSNIAYVSRQYPLSNIDKVEVVYGPASTIYGANAFLGVINVVTRDPDEILGDTKTLGGSAYVGGGAWNTSYLDATVATRFRGAAFSLTGRVFRSDEWDLSRFDEWSYDYAARHESKFKTFVGFSALEGRDPVALARQLDRSVLTALNGEPLAYSDVTRDWMLSGKLKIRDFLFGMQLWQTREGAASSSTKWAQPGARNGNIWVPFQAATYVRYSTALPGNLRLTYFGQAKLHELQPESSEFLLQSYASGPFGYPDLLKNTEPFWLQTRFAQSSNQVRNEVNIVHRVRENLSVIGGVDLRHSSLQTDYSKSSNCNFGFEAPISIPRNVDLDALFAASPDVLTLEQLQLRIAIRSRVSARGPLFLGLEETSRCTRDSTASVEIPAPASGGDHISVREVGVFGQASYRPADTVRLVAGWRVDNGRVDLKGGYGTVSTPRFAFVYSPSPVVLKAVYAEAFKEPTNLERFSTTPGRFQGAGDLKPERVKSFELSAERQFMASAATASTASVSAYRANYTNVIGVTERNLYEGFNTESRGRFSERFAEQWYFTPTANCLTLTDCFLDALRQIPDPNLRRDVAESFLNSLAGRNFTNLGTVQVWGAQANASWRRNRLELFGNYTYAHPAGVGLDLHVGDIARHRGTVGLMDGWGKFDASIRFNIVGTRSTINDGAESGGVLDFLALQGDRPRYDEPLMPLTAPLSSIPGYLVGHLSASYQVLPGLAVQGVVNNLFNTSYAHPGIQTADNVLFAARVPQPPRSLFVRLQSQF